ncbi:MAG: hypothetical protein IH577_01750 [Deltaproteobacteria bacterium]|nr:hypothetical protein [Deltaproteobacteria bacterium]
MKRMVPALILATCVLFLSSCSVKLTNQFARHELLKHHSSKLKYIYAAEIQESSEMGGNIKELMANNKIILSHAGIPVDVYSMMDDANKEIGSIMHNRVKNSYKVQAPVARTTVGEIIEIWEDKDNDMAKVVYTVNLEPLEPYYSKLCIDRNCVYYGDSLKKRNTAAKFFKKQDKGWRMEQ